MKKIKLVISMVVSLMLSCLFVFAGCSFARGLETDVTIVAKDGTDVLKTGVVNTFNSMIMPTGKADGTTFDDAAEQGYYFAGWATVEGWKEGQEGYDESQFYGKEYITYADVKDVAKSGSIVLYPAYKVKLKYYYVLGWYGWTNTSGLNAETMKPIETALEAYLREAHGSEIDGFLAADPDHNRFLDVREYNPGGNSIGGAGALVNKDGDAGLFFGGGSNIDSTGTMYCYAKTNTDSDCIHIGGKNKRVAGLLKNDALSVEVYNWFQDYVQANVDAAFVPVHVAVADLPSGPAVPEEPEEPEEPVQNGDYQLRFTFMENAEYTVNIGWYALTGTSGLDDTYVKSVEDALTAAINEAIKASVGEGKATVHVVLTPLCKDTENTAVKFMVQEIQDANDDADESKHIGIVLGAGNNLTSTNGNTSGTKLTAAAKAANIDMGAAPKKRYVHLLTDTGLNRIVYEWLVNSQAAATALVTSTPVEPAPQA